MPANKPLPTKLKMLRGTLRKNRANPNEPEPKEVKIAGPSVMPLGKFGQAEWVRVTRELIDVRVLTSADYSELERYCGAVEKYFEAQEILLKEGITKDGRPHPQLKTYGYFVELAHKIGIGFGLNPSSRSKINVPTKAKDEPFDNV